MKKQERIPDETIKILHEMVIGKKILVKKGDDKIQGICEYFGYNPHLPDWGLQVTIERMPITNLDIKDIEIVE